MSAALNPRSFLFLLDVLEAGGVQQDVLKIGRALVGRGDRCTIAAFRRDRDSMSKRYADASLSVVFLDKKRAFDIAFLRRLRRLIRHGAFDVVQALSHQAALWAALALPRRNRPVFCGFLFNTHSFDRPLPRILESALTARRLDVVFANSRAGTQLYKDRIFSPPPAFCVPNGVDPVPEVGRAEARKALGIADEEFAVACVGRLVPVKRHEDALKALAILNRQLRPIRLFLIGNGPLRADLESLAQRLGIANAVVFIGERSDVRSLLPAFDVFALPSQGEGMPNALLEAMAAGLPCVATPVGGVPELIADRQNGLLVSPVSPESLAAAIHELHTTPQLALEFGRAAKETIARQFTADQMTRRLLHHYDRLLEARRADIAYVFSQFPKITETFLLRELVEMRRRGLACCAVSLKPPRETVVHPDADALRPLTVALPWLSPRVALDNLAFFAKYPLRYLRSLGEGIGLQLGYPEALLKWLAVWPKTVACARELQRRGVRHVHAAWASVPAASALAMARLLSSPFTFSAHAFDIYASRHPIAAKIRRAEFVTTCTRRNLDFLRMLVPERLHSRIHLVRHFLEFPHDSETAAPDSPPLILSVGALEPYKGHNVLLRAAAQLAQQGRDFRLRIIGRGPDKDALQSLAANLHLNDRVEFTGPLPQPEVFESFRHATLFALASLHVPNGSEDNLPNVLVEAARARVPCAVSRVGSITEFLTDGESALLVQPGDADALADAIRRLLDDAALRQRLALNANLRARALFDREKNATTIETLFRSVLDRQEPTPAGIAAAEN